MAPYSAPSGPRPPPWHVYEVTPRQAVLTTARQPFVKASVAVGPAGIVAEKSNPRVQPQRVQPLSPP